MQQCGVCTILLTVTLLWVRLVASCFRGALPPVVLRAVCYNSKKGKSPKTYIGTLEVRRIEIILRNDLGDVTEARVHCFEPPYCHLLRVCGACDLTSHPLTP